jgi:aminoglycoside phosphotransferase (APT) family kinase protein
MPFITKTPITLDAAQKIVQSHYGAKSQVSGFTELTDGMFNSAYLIEFGDGFKQVLKVAPRDEVRVLRYERNILRTEVEVLRLVKARTEMPVPSVSFYDTSRRLINNDYYLMDFVPGVAYHKLRAQLSPAEQYAIDHQTGVYLRQVNAIQGTGFGLFASPELQVPTWRAGFDSLLKDILLDGQEFPVELHLPYAEIYARLSRCFARLDEVQTPSLVHWDLWDGSIFIDPQSKAITGYIDFERALWADPLMEVNFGAFGENPAFLAGYGAEMLDTPAKKCRRTLYNIYLFLIMVIECYYRQFATKDQENWARLMLQQQLDHLEQFVQQDI